MSTVTKDSVVAIEYKLTVENNPVDASEGEPLVFLQGHGNIIPGLEAAVMGMNVGDEKTVSIQPDQGYGLYEEELIQTIPTSAFDDELEVGGNYTGEDEDGGAVSFTVLEIEGDEALVDFNHPLAGDTLDFWVKVVSVRAATPEELSHGHVHSGADHHAH
jgi:FKBP-type peptidyl-prolyl cis-trans isomerase SlyD